MFRLFRKGLLFYILILVAGGAWLTKVRSTDWDDSLWVTIYPINGDGSPVSAKYIQGISPDTFQPVADHLAKQAEHYGLALRQPFDIRVGPEIREHPPETPFGGNVLQVMWWSLKLRYWADRIEGDNLDYAPDIQIFVQYYDPETHQRLAHSLGLEKGLIGVVNAFAGKRLTSDNNVVIAHELLHTLGATDKYDPRTNMPIHPRGYAEPYKDPLFPQEKAELMAGRIPLSNTNAKRPAHLKHTVVGRQTATEINWLGE